MLLFVWARRWGISPEALNDLLTLLYSHDPAAVGGGESDQDGESVAQRDIRVEAAQLGMRMWRNNVGALQDVNGRPVRYGLANDSKAVNRRIKSSDLIGIRPIMITQQHVGTVIGQFTSREVKAPGWRWGATEREQAQMRWHELVISLGGDSRFATGRGTL